jgi:hypothetical protein
MTMFDENLYDTPGFCRHGLSIGLVNKKQILFVPVLQMGEFIQQQFDCIEKMRQGS